MPEKPLYDNWKFLHPNGEFMFWGSERLGNWYIKKNLAVKLDSTDGHEGAKIVVQLKFQPKGMGAHNNPALITAKNNTCKRCGSTEKLTRHHIIPYRFRKSFPIDMKSHKSEHVVALCEDCHRKYETDEAPALHNDLFALSEKKIYNPEERRVIYITHSAWSALKNWRRLPPQRIEEIINVLNLETVPNDDEIYDKVQEYKAIMSSFESVPSLSAEAAMRMEAHCIRHFDTWIMTNTNFFPIK
jgi:hypothetical protein